MHSKMMMLTAILGMMSLPAFAEPALQPGETLESLSKVRINTSVNGQPGSLKQLAASGQVKLAEELPVSVEDIDSVELESPATQTAAQTTTPAATPAKTLEVATKAEPAAKQTEMAAKAAENTPAVATEEVVNVEDIDPAEPTA